jgi:hypothetical protein
VPEHPLVVCYAPDKGAAYSHALRPASPKKAWTAVARFLAECAELEEPRTVRLAAYRPTEWDDAALLDECVERTVARFGVPDLEAGGGVRFPSGEVVRGGYLEWRAPFARFAEFRDYLIAEEPWPKALVGPVTLSATFRFRWRDPDGAGPLAQQLAGHCTEDGSLRSEFAVTLSQRSTVSPNLWFPFAPIDPRLADLVQLSSTVLPFRLSARHFRLAVPRPSGQGYTYRRFDASGLVAA